jgi:hypothetical protein
MALDEARVDSRQCFLKSLPIMAFYLRIYVDSYGNKGSSKEALSAQCC